MRYCARQAGLPKQYWAWKNKDECDPSGVERRAALAAMAYQFLGVAHHKPMAVIVRAKRSRLPTFVGCTGSF
jgi:hypothetical protein